MSPYVRVAVNKRISHGHTRGGPSPLYRAWVNMISRCTNPKATHYARYGGRGVSVCAKWASFESFLADVGERPSPTHQLDRVNNEGNYEPGNVRWASRKEQCRNRTSSKAVVRSDGAEFATLADAAESVTGTISGVWDVCNQKHERHRGFGWRYA